MKLLINDKEIANFLQYQISLLNRAKEIPFETPNLKAEIQKFVEKEVSKKRNPKKVYVKPKDLWEDNTKKKFYDKIVKAVSRDFSEYYSGMKEWVLEKKQSDFNTIHKNIELFIDTLGIENIFDNYKNSDYKNFVKGTGLTLDNKGTFIRRKEFNSYEEDCLIRNTVGNEDLLVTKIDKKYPFWFIDSGYTNFLEPNKKWHRLVRGHLHYGDFFEAPPTRMENFVKFPVPWRKTGDTIYVIEPGPFAASIFHCDLKTWKYEVEAELRKYTDKPIKFREKAPLRQRTNLFHELLFEDYYCVISINSNAATEAIWAGIPAITLGKHITNPVTRNKLSDINDLYYGNLGSWLAMLSYSQFTKEELMNGTAKRIIDKYHV